MKVIVDVSRKESISVNLCVAKMLAIRWSLQIAKDFNLDRVLIQPNELNAVDCINSLLSLADLDAITSDCRLLLNNFKVAYIMYLSRLFNVDIHHLVSLGRSYGSRT